MKKRYKKTVQTKQRNSGNDVLTSYMNDIKKIPLLTREEELKAAKEAAQGSKAAKDKLINANLRFVVKIAKRYQGQGLPLSDLISEGNIGLMKAAAHFDVNKGFHFISYAVWWVRQSILMAIAEKSRIIRMPIQWNSKLYQIEKSRELAQDYPQVMGDDLPEIAEQLGLDVGKAQEIVRIGQEIVSLEQSGHDPELSPIKDYLINENDASPEENAINLTLHEELEKVLCYLGEREAAIIRARYGLGNQSPQSLEEIGDSFHMSKEGIRQIENRALQHLREPEIRNRLEAFVA